MKKKNGKKTVPFLVPSLIILAVTLVLLGGISIAWLSVNDRAERSGFGMSLDVSSISGMYEDKDGQYVILTDETPIIPAVNGTGIRSPAR